jgi:hypothetical protein
MSPHRVVDVLGACSSVGLVAGNHSLQDLGHGFSCAKGGTGSQPSLVVKSLIIHSTTVTGSKVTPLHSTEVVHCNVTVRAWSHIPRAGAWHEHGVCGFLGLRHVSLPGLRRSRVVTSLIV